MRLELRALAPLHLVRARTMWLAHAHPLPRAYPAGGADSFESTSAFFGHGRQPDKWYIGELADVRNVVRVYGNSDIEGWNFLSLLVANPHGWCQLMFE